MVSNCPTMGHPKCQSGARYSKWVTGWMKIKSNAELKISRTTYNLFNSVRRARNQGNQGKRFYESAATFSSAARLTMVMDEPFTWISFFRLNSANVRETVSRDAPTI